MHNEQNYQIAEIQMDKLQAEKSKIVVLIWNREKFNIRSYLQLLTNIHDSGNTLRIGIKHLHKATYDDFRISVP